MPSKKLLEKQYNLLLPHLQGIAQYVEKILGFLPSSDFQLETNVKSLESIARKMKDKKEKNILKLSDLVRGRIFFSSNYTHESVVKLLKKIFGNKLEKADQVKTKAHGLKYKGIMHFDLRIDSLLFELQIIPVEYKPFKKLLHRIYEKLRDENHLSKQQKEKLRELHNKLSDDLCKKSRENRK